MDGQMDAVKQRQKTWGKESKRMGRWTGRRGTTFRPACRVPFVATILHELRAVPDKERAIQDAVETFHTAARIIDCTQKHSDGKVTHTLKRRETLKTPRPTPRRAGPAAVVVRDVHTHGRALACLRRRAPCETSSYTGTDGDVQRGTHAQLDVKLSISAP